MSKGCLKLVFTLCLYSMSIDGGVFSAAFAYEPGPLSRFSGAVKFSCEQALVNAKNTFTLDADTKLERILDFAKKESESISRSERQNRINVSRKMILKMAPAIAAKLRKEGLLHPSKQDHASGYVLKRKAVEALHPTIAQIVPADFDLALDLYMDTADQLTAVDPIRKRLFLSYKNLYTQNSQMSRPSLLRDMVQVALHKERARTGTDRWGLVYHTTKPELISESSATQFFMENRHRWSSEEIFVKLVQALAVIERHCHKPSASSDLMSESVMDFAVASSFIKGHRLLGPKYISTLYEGAMIRERRTPIEVSLRHSHVRVALRGEKERIARKDFGIHNVELALSDENIRLRALEHLLSKIYKFPDSHDEIKAALFVDYQKMYYRLCSNRGQLWPALDKASGVQLSQFRYVLREP